MTFPMPKHVGDTYVLVGYPFDEAATFAIAFHRGGSWWLEADDGDLYPIESVEKDVGTSQIPWNPNVMLVRRAHEDLAPFVVRLALSGPQYTSLFRYEIAP